MSYHDSSEFNSESCGFADGECQAAKSTVETTSNVTIRTWA